MTTSTDFGPEHAAIVERMRDLTGELERIAAHDKPTRKQEARAVELTGEFEDLEDRRRAVEREAELDRLRAIGEGRAPGRVAPIGRSDYGDEPAFGGGGGLRDQARRTLDGLRAVPEDGKQRLTRAFERAESGFDGGGELDHLSRWLLATSSPAYARAVGKLFRDPEQGHREFTTEELAAYQSAKQIQRAMSIGTDTAGGFLLPTHLDPQILLSNAGAVDPIRRIARVETIGSDTWNGVSSAGVTASWDAEADEVSDDSPTLAQPSVPTHKGAAFVAASIEAAMDTSIGEQVAALWCRSQTSKSTAGTNPGKDARGRSRSARTGDVRHCRARCRPPTTVQDHETHHRGHRNDHRRWGMWGRR